MTSTLPAEVNGRFIGREAGIFEENALLQTFVAKLDKVLNGLVRPGRRAAFTQL